MAEAILTLSKGEGFYRMITSGMEGIRSIHVETLDGKEPDSYLEKYAVIVGDEIYPEHYDLILRDKFDNKFITVFLQTLMDCELKLVMQTTDKEEDI